MLKIDKDCNERVLSRRKSRVVTYRGANHKVFAGYGFPVLVNASIGLNGRSNLRQEITKLKKILSNANTPDLMMDLSIVASQPEMWEVIRDEFGGPVGILPHYLVFDEKKGIDKKQLIERIEKTIKSGIGFITIHCTPNSQLLKLALETRSIPITSRGGSIIIRDMLINKRRQSIYFEIFDDIARLAQQNGVVLNLGTSFRAACIRDGLDRAMLEELKIQKELIERAHAIGTQVILEGPGHMILSQIDQYIELTNNLNVPRMPLGPIVTDSFPGMDHIVNAIGSAYMLSRCRGGIINAITRIEHKGNLPSAKMLIEAIEVAHVAAHAATINYHKKKRDRDHEVSNIRAKLQSCVLQSMHQNVSVISKDIRRCTRCGHLCPLIRKNYSNFFIYG